jgi:hypothetical protein
MIDPKQLRSLVKRTLKRIPHGYSESSEVAVLMLSAHESRLGKYLKQTQGPALGMGQIEPITHDDTWKHGDTCAANAKILRIDRDVERLEYDLVYQIFMIRQRLFMKPEALPPSNDPWAIAEYLKKHWNTTRGKAEADDYYKAYNYYYGELL